MAGIFIDSGTAADDVTKRTNTTGEMTPIAEVNADRGTFLRLINVGLQGGGFGIPHYMDLRDTNGNKLPPNTNLRYALEVAGRSSKMKVSRLVKSISDWNQLTLTEQRNTEHIDSTKITLTEPEHLGGEAVENLDFRDVDTLYFEAESSAQIDWSQSTYYLESKAVKGPFQR